jgi:hypothetical protein
MAPLKSKLRGASLTGTPATIHHAITHNSLSLLFLVILLKAAGSFAAA